MPEEQPGGWTPAEATKKINECARQADFTISLTKHAREQMQARELMMGDVIHLLRGGFVYDDPVPATRDGYYKYAVEGTTPNSDGRAVRTIAIPDGMREVKIVTVMWRTEA